MAEELKQEGEVEPKVESAPAGGEKKPETKDVPFSEHPRWKEVYGGYKEYKQYGSPSEIGAQLERLAQLESAFEQAQAQAEAAKRAAAQTPDDQKKAQLEAQARAELKKLLPELNELEALRAAQDARNARLEAAAVSETKKLLADMGSPDEKEDVLAMSDILADIIKNDRELLSEYEVNPRQSVRGAFEKFAGRFKAVGERSATAKKQADREVAAKLPKAHGAGGSGGEGEGAKEPPKTLAEATKRAIERLKGVEL